jgi:hypothetical protein
MADQTYDDGRARNLRDMLVALAERIKELDASGRLLPHHAGEMLRLMGEVRSELFHFEVRATYDTPEVSESRRIVADAISEGERGSAWQKTEWTPDGEDDPAS